MEDYVLHHFLCVFTCGGFSGYLQRILGREDNELLKDVSDSCFVDEYDFNELTNLRYSRYNRLRF